MYRLLALLFIYPLVRGETNTDFTCNGRDEECVEQADGHFICDYDFQVQEFITMRYTGDTPYPVSFPVFERDNGEEFPQLFYLDCPNGNYAAGPVLECPEVNITRDDPNFIGADGFARRVTAINGGIPAPILCVGWHDTVRARVENRISGFGYETTTIHWHGMFQETTPWMDGVAFITQCPILPGNVFVYEFDADPPGTYWYHSHSGVQVADGEFGALIVQYEQELQEELYEGIFDVDQPDQVVILDDWEHENYQAVTVKNPGHWMDEETGLPIKNPTSQDGSFTSGHPFVSGLINGRGNFEENDMEPFVFKIQRNKRTRFRLVSASAMFPFLVSVDNHRITLLSQDGFDIEPVEMDGIMIWPAERYDFVVNADQEGDDFFLRAQTLEFDQDHHVLAIVHIEDEGDEEEAIVRPTTTSNFAAGGRCEPGTDEECLVGNCPWVTQFSSNTQIKCLSTGDFTRFQKTPEELDEDLPVIDDNVHWESLNFNILGALNAQEIPNVEGVFFQLPHEPPLISEDPLAIDQICAKGTRGTFEACTQVIDLDFEETYVFLLTNRWPLSADVQSAANFPGIMPHPMHMHGHSFSVLAESAGSLFDEDRGDAPRTRGCENGVGSADWPEYCYDEQTLSGNLICDEYWGACRIIDPSLLDLKDVKDAPQKDTIVIPTHGYVIIAIKASNPGWWITHCHIDVHMAQGMALVLNEALPQTEELIRTCLPDDFPTCHDFNNHIPATCERGYPSGKGKQPGEPEHVPDLTEEQIEKLLQERIETGTWDLSQFAKEDL